MQLFTLFANWSSVKFSHLSDAAHCRLVPHLEPGGGCSCSRTSKVYLYFIGAQAVESGNETIKHYISPPRQVRQF